MKKKTKKKEEKERKSFKFSNRVITGEYSIWFCDKVLVIGRGRKNKLKTRLISKTKLLLKKKNIYKNEKAVSCKEDGKK